MKHHILHTLARLCLLAALPAMLASCGSGPAAGPSANAVYYWKSWVNLSDTEQRFLAENSVDRVYLRFFDIRNDFRSGPVPDAEVAVYRSDFPESAQIVPCVFITLEALGNMEGREREFATKIYNRIDAKCKNGGVDYGEIQLDCDWTESTRPTFFALCKELRALTSAAGKQLSSTIRLHQLSQPAPDVDHGVLMVYNVGELKNPKESNSILRSDIVRRYLDNAPAYPLQLDVAYPVFSWGVVFNGSEFSHLTKIDADPQSIPGLTHLRDNLFALQSNISDEVGMDYRQTVRYEMPTFAELMATKRLVEKYLGYKPARTILYHLDEEQLSKYTPEQISKIYE